MKELKKPYAKIGSNGLVHFYNTDGTRNEEHPTGFYNSKNLEFYKQNYNIIK